MKTMIFAAAAVLSIGASAAFAQGVPAGYEPPHYGAAAFSNQSDLSQNSDTRNSGLARNSTQAAPASAVRNAKTSVGG